MELQPNSLVFNVHRRTPELISPAKPTPRELKPLSDIDDQESLRNPIRVIYFFRHNTSLIIKGIDPVEVIRKALAETLVYYYPMAGRLREGPNRKLMVECTSEGVVFIEADADVALEELEDALHPPFPCLEELLFDVEYSIGSPNSPLLLIQVTRLKGGGFIFALTLNHVMFDAASLCQFIQTMGELARGANAPSVLPVWDRPILTAKFPARVTYAHPEYNNISNTIPHDDKLNKVQRSFFFGPKEISVLRRLIPVDLRGHVTNFELLVSFLWRCRTIAMKPFLNTETRLAFPVNIRNLFKNPSISTGFYGNALLFLMAVATVNELSEGPLEYALKLVREAKSNMTYEYVRSTMDLLSIKGKPPIVMNGTYIVSDTSRFGFDKADFGWGLPVFGGPAEGRVGDIDGVSFVTKYKNKKGEIGNMLAIILPELAMERFLEELARIFEEERNNKTTSIKSLL